MNGVDPGTVTVAVSGTSGLATLWWVVRALVKGHFIPKAAVQSMAEAWKANDTIREAARREESAAMRKLIEDLQAALKVVQASKSSTSAASDANS